MSTVFDAFGITLEEAKARHPMDAYEHLVPAELPWSLHNGDALEVLKTLPDNTYDACYCDPPYGLSDRKRIRQYEDAKRDMPSEVFSLEHTPLMGSGSYVLDFPGTSQDAGLTFNEESFQCLVYLDGEAYRLTISNDGQTGSLDQNFSALQQDLVEAGDIAKMVEVEDLEGDACVVQAQEGELKLHFDRQEYLKALKKLPSGGFMGRGWDSDVPSAEVWREVMRVLKPGAPLLAFGGTRVWHRLAVNIEDAGFEIRDTFMYLHGQGFPKGLDISKGITAKAKTGKANPQGIREIEMGDEYEPSGRGRVNYDNGGGSQMNGTTSPSLEVVSEAERWVGYKTAIKPAFEPIVCAHKPLDGTYVNNALEHGVAGYNIDGSRIGTSKRAPGGLSTSKDGGGSLSGSVDGSLRNETGEEEGHNPKIGRYPTNVVLSHTDECVCKGTKKVKGHKLQYTESEESKGEGGFSEGWTGRPQGVNLGHTDEDGNETVEDWDCVDHCPVKILDDQSGILTSGAMKRVVDPYEGESQTGFMRGHSGPHNQHGGTGGASRFYYCAKASTSEREAGLVPEPGKKRANPHPTCKPLDLNRYFTKLILPPAREDEPRKMLIPFSGVGSEMIGAFKGGWDHVTGIELQEQYVELAEQRLRWWVFGGGADE